MLHIKPGRKLVEKLFSTLIYNEKIDKMFHHSSSYESCLEVEARVHGTSKTTTKNSLTRIEKDGSPMGTVNQSLFWLLKAEYLARGIAME
jgi:hypothetical protein